MELELEVESPPPGASRAKLAAVGLLAAVLAGVLYFEYGPGAGAGDDEASTGPRARPAMVSAAAAAAALSAVQPPPRVEVDLAELVRHNPFALGTAVVPTEASDAPAERVAAAARRLSADERRARLERLRGEGVQWIIVRDGQATARIGTRELRVGDVVDGFLVTAIDTQGVVLVEAQDEPDR